MCWSGFGTEKWLKLVMDFMYFIDTAVVDFFFGLKSGSRAFVL